MEKSTQLVEVAVEEGVATLLLNDPAKLNALSIPMAKALTAALEQAGRDPAVRAVVLRGAQGKFCAGGDVTSMKKRLR